MTDKIIQDWFNKGSQLNVPGTVSTRIWRQGTGPKVVCLHGVPTSAYLYRKVLPELAGRGLEGIAMDFPGLGFSDRPSNFEYTWTALSGWLEKALAAANIDKFNLVLHDVGGPVGFDLVRRIPDRIESLTVLNTIIDVGTFKKPVVMRPFSVPLLGRLWVLQMNSPLIVGMFRMKGVLPGPSYEELRAYGKLLTRVDGGRGFQKIMSRFETTSDFEERIKAGLQNRKFPAQIIWGKYDDELTVDKMGTAIKRALNLQTDIYQVEGKHFLQENCALEIAERVAAIVKAGEDL